MTTTMEHFVAQWTELGDSPVLPGAVLYDVEAEHRATPRGINTENAGGPTLNEWIDYPEQTRLYRVLPVGDDLGTDPPRVAADEWLIVEELSPGQVLGPQADEIYRAARNIEPLYDTNHPSRAARTDSEWERLADLYAYNDDDLATEHEAIVGAQAALHALNTIDTDQDWDLGSCQHGNEYAAIAARDLIGTVPGWTQTAYDSVMARYRRAFGHETSSGVPELVGPHA